MELEYRIQVDSTPREPTRIVLTAQQDYGVVDMVHTSEMEPFETFYEALLRCHRAMVRDICRRQE
jgi:hypothetical protein